MCRGLVTAHLVCIFESSPRLAPVSVSRAARREEHLHWHLNLWRVLAEPLIGRVRENQSAHWLGLSPLKHHLSLADNKTVKCSSRFVPEFFIWGEGSTPHHTKLDRVQTRHLIYLLIIIIIIWSWRSGLKLKPRYICWNKCIRTLTFIVIAKCERCIG